MTSSISNDDIIELHNYIHYILRSVYYNYINTDTGIALSRLFVIVLFVSIFHHYDLLVFFLIIVIILEISSYTQTLNHNHISSWLGIWPEIRKYVSIDNNNDTFSNIISNHENENDNGLNYNRRTLTETVNDLTKGVFLNETKSSHVIEGFSLPSITIAKGDDTGRDYHNSNTFVKLNSQEFSDNYFESKKCGYSGGIGSISLFGSNEIIGKSRDVIMNSVYDFKGNISNPTKYFKDCVYDPIKRTNFRPFKKQVFTDINDNIMNIESVLARFSTGFLNNKVDKDTTNYYVIGNILNKPGNLNDYFKRVDDKSKEQYTLLIKKVNNEKDADYDIKYKNRKLEIYNKVYGFKTKLNEFFERIEAQYKQNNNVIGTMSISDTTLQELRQIIDYLRVVKMSKDIVELSAKKNIDNAPQPQTIELKTALKSLKIYESDLDKSYNTPDEQRYLWGISYYYNNATIPYS